MLKKKPLLLLLLLFVGLKAFPAVFTVTSNLDAGPGTLRDALTQAAANGSATTDYIYFNLTDLSVAGRTITILTDLPPVSSNLVIDGTTQPGVKFGVSDAKVKIIAMLNSAYTITCCFNLSNQHNVEIYGFLMDSANLAPSTGGGISGIYGILVQNVIIGAPGKGNIMKNLEGINFNSNGTETNSTISENIKISSNIIGLGEDGEALTGVYGESIYADRIRNLTIGGSTAAEGNIFGGLVDVTEEDTNFDLNTGDLLVSNNFFGTDFSGTKALPNSLSGAEFFISSYNLKSVEISQNLFVGYSDVDVGSIPCFFKIIGNKFGTDITGTKVLGTFQFPLILGYCAGGGIIGGTNPSDANIFSGAYLYTSVMDPGAVVLNVGSPNVEVTGNIFRCNNSTYPYSLSLINSQQYFVTISKRTAGSISGTATANSRVDLYYSLTCSHCEPEKQFASVNADAAGNWVYNATLLDYNILASSTSNGTTSEFTSLRFLSQPQDIKIKMACGGNNGAITGFVTNNNTINYTWYDSNGKVVSHNKDLTNAAPGSYYLLIDDGYCSVSSGQYQIKDAENQVDISKEKITPTSCNNNDGSITGIQADPTSSFQWTDASGNIVGSYPDLTSVPSGNYTLRVTTADGSCSQTLGPITIKNLNGPNIDQSNAAIRSTNCGQSTGSITGITATGSGTLKYTWLNSQQQTVGNTPDLTNQPAGTYKLEVTDDSQCGPIYTSDISIPETNGITIDESGAQTTVASCSNNNGSITGIKVSGATQYQWVNGSGQIVGATIDLQGLAPGNYTLTASNSFGCIRSSKVYTVGQLPPTKFPDYADNITTACYQGAGGAITVSTDGLVKSARWVNAQGADAGSGSSLTNVPAGTYQLYLTDQNGCENYYNTYTVAELPEFKVVSAGTITNDQCDLGIGSISSPEIAGGEAPYTYTWYDANNKQIASGPTINNLKAGTYVLNVVGARCGQGNILYTVVSESEDIPPPSVSNTSLCSSGNALIAVNDPVASGTYNLYGNATDTQPLQQQPGGKFVVNVKNNTSFYISRQNGTCESSRSEVQVSVGLSALNIANTFTPNGDGINDVWNISGIVNYPQAEVQVFNRWGQRVFYSKGYSTPFDGTYAGKNLPEGVYYYIISFSADCNVLSGSLTIIR